MNRQNTTSLPVWAAITLGISVIATALIAGVGIVVILNEDDESTTVRAVDEAPQSIAVDSTIELLPTLTILPSTATITSIPLSPSATTQATATSTATVIATDVDAEEDTTESDEIDTVDCLPPDGWEGYTVQQGDTLFAFQLGATRAGNPATVDEILEANCMPNSFLSVDQFLYLPPGAAENAPPSEPVAPVLPAGITRDANCPCQLSIQAGWRIEQIADAINRTPVAFSGADFLAATGRGAPLPSRDFLASVPPGSGLEGFMFPGTYTLQNDTTAVQFRDMMLDTFAANAAAVVNSVVAQGITPYEGLILASIVQKESGNPDDQRLVASVFFNRRATGRAFGATVTIQYALGTQGNWWPRLQSGQTNIDSPYNTYRFLGFPPTPISSPSLSALQAVAAPAQTNYIYFTGNCRGPGNVFAATYEEHLANVNCE